MKVTPAQIVISMIANQAAYEAKKIPAGTVWATLARSYAQNAKMAKQKRTAEKALFDIRACARSAAVKA